MKAPRVPGIPRVLLRWTLPKGPRWEAVLGDLEEEYVERYARDGAARARLWYWREGLAVAARYATAPDPGLSTNEGIHGRGRRGRGMGMDQLIHNIQYAVRRMGRTPLFTLVAVLSLGLGIGANTAIFSMVNAVIIRDLPLERPEELVDLFTAGREYSYGSVSFPDYRDLSDRTGDVFSDLAASRLALVQADLDGGEVEGLMTEGVTGNYFPTLGIEPAVGRLIEPQDHVEPGAHPVVVLSYAHWESRYGADPGVLGETLRISGRPYTIIGVTPQDYTGNLRGIAPQIYLPIYMVDMAQGTGLTYESRGSQSLFLKARLLPGVGTAQMEAALERVALELRQEAPDFWPGDKSFSYVPTQDVILNPMVDRIIVPAAGVLMGVVGLVLLIACANLASFLLARAADRRKEIAVRLAMGARRRTLVGQLLTETLLLSVLGGSVGILLATGALRALQSADLPLPIPITLDLSLDATVLGFSLVATLAAGILFGLAPALQGTNPALAPTLRDETAGGGRAKGAYLRSALVVGQVAVSVVLLVGAGLFLRSLQASQELDPGFGDAPAALVQLTLPASEVDDQETLVFFDELRARVAALPGVEAVGLADNMHLNPLNSQYTRVQVAGVQPTDGRDFHPIDYTSVSPGFFQATGIPLVAGRPIQESDRADTDRVVVVSEAFAERFFPGTDAVGQIITLSAGDARVVGVARDAKVGSLGEAPRPFVYTAHRQDVETFNFVIARTTGDAGPVALSIVREARALDPRTIVFEVDTMERHLATLLLGRKLGAQVILAFAVLAMLLASIGLYGVVSYSVARRIREVGIRLSLGAEAGEVVWMLTRSGMRLVVVGGGIGLVLAAGLSQFLSRLLYGVPVLDPLTFVVVPVVLGGVALLASWVPAMRAARIDPVGALRSE